MNVRVQCIVSSADMFLMSIDEEGNARIPSIESSDDRAYGSELSPPQLVEIAVNEAGVEVDDCYELGLWQWHGEEEVLEVYVIVEPKPEVEGGSLEEGRAWYSKYALRDEEGFIPDDIELTYPAGVEDAIDRIL